MSEVEGHHEIYTPPTGFVCPLGEVLRLIHLGGRFSPGAPRRNASPQLARSVESHWAPFQLGWAIARLYGIYGMFLVDFGRNR